MTNTGTEKPSTEKPITARSSSLPCRQAARMPSGMATSKVKTSVSTARLMDGSRRCPISLVTGTPDMSEVPRSPFRSLPPQMTNCLMTGWSRPIV
ncbi:hypothetical protein D3C72_2070310 [compost metagenome]